MWPHDLLWYWIFFSFINSKSIKKIQTRLQYNWFLLHLSRKSFFSLKKMLLKACKNNLPLRILNNFFFSFLKPSQLQNLDLFPKYILYMNNICCINTKDLCYHILELIYQFLYLELQQSCLQLFLLFIDLQFGNMNLFVGHLLCVLVVSSRQQSIFSFTFSFKSSVNSCV